MKNLSSNKCGKGSASSTSTSSQRKGASLTSTSSVSASSSRPASWNPRGSKQPASPSSSSCPKSTLKSTSQSPAKKSSQIGVMSLASHRRWLFGPPLDHLESQGCGTLGGGGFTEGLSYPMRNTTSFLSGSDIRTQLFSHVHQGSGSSWRGDGPCGQGSGMACSSLSRVIQPPLRRLEGFGVVEDRPVASKQVRTANSLQNGDNPVGSSVHLEVRLDVLH